MQVGAVFRILSKIFCYDITLKGMCFREAFCIRMYIYSVKADCQQEVGHPQTQCVVTNGVFCVNVLQIVLFVLKQVQ